MNKNRKQSLTKEIQEFINQVEIISENSYLLSGTTMYCENNVDNNNKDSNHIISDLMSSGIATSGLVNALKNTIYEWAYTKRFSTKEWIEHHQTQTSNITNSLAQNYSQNSELNQQLTDNNSGTSGLLTNQNSNSNTLLNQESLATQTAITNQQVSSFVSLLSQSNHSKNRLDSGWSVYHADNQGNLSVQKGSRYHLLSVGEYAALSRSTLPAQVGDHVAAIIRKESTTVQPDFYYCFSDIPHTSCDDQALFRLYFNCTHQGAIYLIDFISRELNKFDIPFRFKCLSNPVNYQRRDPAVLYVDKRYFQIVFALVNEHYPLFSSFLNDDVPLFSKPLLAGIGLAEDPGNGESFGMHRSKIVAQGIVNAWLKRKTGLDQRLDEIKLIFSESNLVFDQPYLNAYSPDLFYSQVSNKLDMENTENE